MKVRISLIWAALGLGACLLGSCVSLGPVAVDPDRDFSGLKDVLNDVPEGGTLDVFLFHGMRADTDQTYQDIIVPIVARLPLSPATRGPWISLVQKSPTISFDGVTVFDSTNWDKYQPRYMVEHHVTNDGHKKVNFYYFNYWNALAYLKCRYTIAPDTRVEGSSTRSRYCTDQQFAPKTYDNLSSSPEWANQMLKTEIMEWGLADAVIATSQYRTVLRHATREMLKDALLEARASDGIGVFPKGLTAEAELHRMAASGKTRFAFISASLGSYVISDTLVQSLSKSPEAEAEREFFEPDVAVRTAEELAPAVVVCGASQLHMFANQLALLRFSELSVSGVGGGNERGSAISPPAATKTTGAHFFRGCPASEAKSGAGGAFGARQVVAFHEPNDLLTYYASDRPGDVGADNEKTTNVVLSFTTNWIWFLAADPLTAHTGYPNQDPIRDMVVCGHRAGTQTTCPH